MSNNSNRLVWANGFTNDKSTYSNKEAYKKACKKCNKSIWMRPENKGWSVFGLDGLAHKCSKKKSKRKKGNVKTYVKDCGFCGVTITMRQEQGNWKPLEDGKRHKCKDVTDDDTTNHMAAIMLE